MPSMSKCSTTNLQPWPAFTVSPSLSEAKLLCSAQLSISISIASTKPCRMANNQITLTHSHGSRRMRRIPVVSPDDLVYSDNSWCWEDGAEATRRMMCNATRACWGKCWFIVTSLPILIMWSGFPVRLLIPKSKLSSVTTRKGAPRRRINSRNSSWSPRFCYASFLTDWVNWMNYLQVQNSFQ